MPWRLLTLLLTGQLLASMDASILTVATPVLQHELDASPTMLQAIFAAYTFTFGVLVVTGARLGDDRGHGNMFLAGLAGFTASSLLCGLAPSAPVLLAGRLVQGACGALMTPQTLQVIQRRFDGDARAKAVGLYSLILSVGVLAGQLVGGVIVTTAGWRWALLINVPAGSALFVAAFRLARDRAARAREAARRCGRRRCSRARWRCCSYRCCSGASRAGRRGSGRAWSRAPRPRAVRAGGTATRGAAARPHGAPAGRARADHGRGRDGLLRRAAVLRSRCICRTTSATRRCRPAWRSRRTRPASRRSA